jgi:hypothetical protein
MKSHPQAQEQRAESSFLASKAFLSGGNRFAAVLLSK